MTDIKEVVDHILEKANLPIDGVVGWGINIKVSNQCAEPELETLIVSYKHDQL